MHEVGIISSILKTVEKVMAQENLTHVEKITLTVGELSGVLPHYMEECYPAAVYRTQFENTKMEIEVIPGIVHCEECDEEFNAYRFNLTCPKCHNKTSLTPLSGRELMIKEIEGY